MRKINKLVTEEKGIQHAEEALLLALIAVALVAVVTTLKNAISGVFTSASTAMG